MIFSWHGCCFKQQVLSLNLNLNLTPSTMKPTPQMKRRVLVALRPASPVERLLKVGAALCHRMQAELEVLADPSRTDWSDIESRLVALEHDGLACRLTPAPGLDAKKVVEHARRHECVASVIVGRPAAWAGENPINPWNKLECPLVAASDHPDLPEEI
jgi:hypothetical protein